MIKRAEKSILVTRPGKKGIKLCRLLQNSHYSTFYLPLIKIEPLSKPDWISADKTQQKSYQIALFVSPNAVKYVPPDFKKYIEAAQIGAVGKATYEALQQQGFDVELVPDEQFNSEALLKQKALTEVKDKRILIVRGQGGREKLKTELQQRGAVVDYLEVYKRKEIEYENKTLQQFIEFDAQYIQVSNQQSLEILMRLTSNLCWSNQRKWIVLSDRTLQRLEELGVDRSNIYKVNPGNEGLLNFLKELEN